MDRCLHQSAHVQQRLVEIFQFNAQLTHGYFAAGAPPGSVYRTLK
jgi:hypothetical protein